MNIRRAFLAVVICFSGLAALTALAITLLYAANDLRPSFTGDIQLRPGPSGSTTTSVLKEPLSEPHAMLELWVENLDVKGLQALTRSRLVIPRELAVQIFDLGNGRKVFYIDSVGNLILEPVYSKEAFYLKIMPRVVGGIRGSPMIFPVPLGELQEKRGRLSGETITLNELSVAGQSELFPNDWYWLSYYVHLEVPDSLVLRRGAGPYSTVLPLDIRVGLGPGMGTLVADLARSEPDSQVALEMMIHRGTITRLLYLLLVVPILVLIALIGYVALERSVQKQVPIWGLITAVGATMLSLLPLRSAVVPEVFSSPTLVDVVLVFVFTFLVFMLAFAVGRHEWKGTGK